MAQWMPLCLWAFHRTVSGGRLRDGLLTGLFLALQTLSSFYYGIFFATYLVPVGARAAAGSASPARLLAGDPRAGGRCGARGGARRAVHPAVLRGAAVGGGAADFRGRLLQRDAAATTSWRTRATDVRPAVDRAWLPGARVVHGRGGRRPWRWRRCGRRSRRRAWATASGWRWRSSCRSAPTAWSIRGCASTSCRSAACAFRRAWPSWSGLSLAILVGYAVARISRAGSSRAAAVRGVVAIIGAGGRCRVSVHASGCRTSGARPAPVYEALARQPDAVLLELPLIAPGRRARADLHVLLDVPLASAGQRLQRLQPAQLR